jgi:hypothetical protein
VYRRLVKPQVLGLIRVGAHYAMSSLFEPQDETDELYCYAIDDVHAERFEDKAKTLSVGRARIRSAITHEELVVQFAAIHMGAHQVFGGVARYEDERRWQVVARDISALFSRGRFSDVQEKIETCFPTGQYSLEHLFKDEQRRILYQVLDGALGEVETSLRQIHEYHQPIVEVIKQLHIPLPKVLSHMVLAMINADLMRALAQDDVDLDQLAQLIDEVKQWSLEIDKQAVTFLLQRKVTALMTAFARAPQETSVLADICFLLHIVGPLFLPLDLWKAQNIYFDVGKKRLEKERTLAGQGNRHAQQWIAQFGQVGQYLRVKIV